MNNEKSNLAYEEKTKEINEDIIEAKTGEVLININKIEPNPIG